eukprot:TRINITY_DN6135_c1_g2_i3.p2 TRINITY_DN6135_c1_g2~~TRINITY_DN6135_c1_g2_i3.p2  ORF type:complete len:118 (-),score=22.78 TRINITY_DN6135_c1_g2_i3:381-734(-)
MNNCPSSSTRPILCLLSAATAFRMSSTVWLESGRFACVRTDRLSSSATGMYPSGRMASPTSRAEWRRIFVSSLPSASIFASSWDSCPSLLPPLPPPPLPLLPLLPPLPSLAPPLELK